MLILPAMDDKEQARRVEAALAGRHLPELCGDCQKTKTTTHCTLCKKRVCSKCQTLHRRAHDDRQARQCDSIRLGVRCQHKTAQRCRTCPSYGGALRAVCGHCRNAHFKATGHNEVKYGAGRYFKLYFKDLNTGDEHV